MKVAIVILCLVGAVCANPILHGVVLKPSKSELNTTQSSSASESSDQSDTSELQSSEENTSEVTSEDQTSESESESESSESNSENVSSEESQSKSLEDTAASSVKGVTRDNSLGSEENVRKGWLRVFANVVRAPQSHDDNSSSSSAEVKGQPDPATSDEDAGKERTSTRAPPAVPATTAPPAQASESSESSESAAADDSSETSETSETSDSSDTSESTESAASDSAERQQARGCQQGVHSDSGACSSEEQYPFLDVGDDAHRPVGDPMAPGEEEHREFSLRR